MKIYDDFKDQNVRATVIFLDPFEGSTAWKDSHYQEAFKTSELKEVYLKGCIIIDYYGNIGTPAAYLSPTGSGQGRGGIGFYHPSEGFVVLWAEPDDPDALRNCNLTFYNMNPFALVFGKQPVDLQDGVDITSDNQILGLSKYVDDYDGFALQTGDEADSQGNFLAFTIANRFDIPFEFDTSDVHWAKEIVEEQMIYVVRLIKGSTESLTITLSSDGFNTITKTYDVRSLTMEDPS